MKVFSVLFAACIFLVPTAQAFDLPPNDGFVTDAANILSETEKDSLASYLKEYALTTSNEIVILIIPTLQGEDAATVAIQALRTWGIGNKDLNNGVLILHAYAERQVFIATGKGIEGDLPDIAVAHIIDTNIVPNFKDAKYAAGFMVAVQDIQEYLTHTKNAKDLVTPDYSVLGIILFVLSTFFEAIVAFFARTKQWWAGGIAGAIFGIILVYIYTWWLSIPLLIILGLAFDYIVSKYPNSFKSTRRGRSGLLYGAGRSSGYRFGGGTSSGGGAGRSY